MAKYKQNNPNQPVVKSAVVLRNETQDRIEAIRRRLGEIKQYKRLIAADGLEPDQDDKRLESELIVRLLRLEKSLKPQARPKGKPQEEAAPRRSSPTIRNRMPRRQHEG